MIAVARVFGHLPQNVDKGREHKGFLFIRKLYLHHRLPAPEGVNIDFKQVPLIGQAIACFMNRLPPGIPGGQAAVIFFFGQRAFDFNPPDGR